MVESTYACIDYDTDRAGDDGEEFHHVSLLNGLALIDSFDTAIAFATKFGGTIWRLDATPVFSPADAYFTQGNRSIP